MKGWSFFKTTYWFRIISRMSIKVCIKKKFPYCLIKVAEELGSLFLYHPITIGRCDMISSLFDAAAYQHAAVTPNHSPFLRKLSPYPPLIAHLTFPFKYSSSWSFLLVIVVGLEMPGLTLLTSALWFATSIPNLKPVQEVFPAPLPLRSLQWARALFQRRSL